MSKENTREQKLQYIFAQNPKDNEFHVTSDHQAFRIKSDAMNHAKTLEDKEVKTEKRSDYVKSKKAEADPKAEATKEREALFDRHEELFGKKPAKNAGNDTIKAKIATEEARLAEVAKLDESDVPDDDPTGEEE